MVVNASGTLAAITDHEFKVRLWDLCTQEVIHTLGTAHATRDVLLRYFTSGTDFHPKLPLLAVCGRDSIIRVYDTKTGEETQILDKHTERVSALSFHPSGDMLATASQDKCDPRLLS